MQPRTKQLSLRLNAEEYSHLKRLSDTSGLKLEPTIRALIMGVDLKPRPPDEMAEINRQMSGIGININQIARKVNASNAVMISELQEIKVLLAAMWNKLDQL